MTQKIVFFDIDGTLVTEGSCLLPDSTVTAIQALQQNGHLAFINSGRTYFNVLPHSYIQAIPFDGFVLGCGTQILCHGESLFYHGIPKELHQRVVDAVRDNRMQCMFEGEHQFYFDLSANRAPMILDFERRFCQGPQENYSIDRPDKHFEKLVTWETPESNVKGFQTALGEEFIYIDRGNGFGEICQRTYDKATGIQFLLDHFHLSLDDCYVFGDSNNDVSMLSYVKHSILMGNGNPELMDSVEFVTKRVEEDGVAFALSHYGLI